MFHGIVYCSLSPLIYAFMGFFHVLLRQSGGGISLLLMTISVISVLATVYIDFHFNKHIWAFSSVCDANVFLAVSTSIPLFMFFKDLKMKYHKWINTIAASTFGVLLIHANSDTMRQWLWRDTLQNAEQFYMSYACVHAMISVITIFAICIAIDNIRINTLEKWMFIVIDKYLAKYKLK